MLSAHDLSIVQLRAKMPLHAKKCAGGVIESFTNKTLQKCCGDQIDYDPWMPPVWLVARVTEFKLKLTRRNCKLFRINISLTQFHTKINLKSTTYKANQLTNDCTSILDARNWTDRIFSLRKFVDLPFPWCVKLSPKCLKREASKKKNS